MMAEGGEGANGRRRTIERFFDGLTAGGFADDLFAADVSFWTTASGTIESALYMRVPAMLAAIFPQGLAFNIGSIILEADRAAAEVRSQGTFDGDQVYTNDYAFLFRFDGERIVSVAEHFNPLRVPPSLAERMQSSLSS